MWNRIKRLFQSKEKIKYPHDYLVSLEPPVENDENKIVDLVAEDLYQRAEFGKKKYGTYLQPFNGRNALWDAYQEALDLVMYLRQLITEEDELNGPEDDEEKYEASGTLIMHFDVDDVSKITPPVGWNKATNDDRTYYKELRNPALRPIVDERPEYMKEINDFKDITF